MKNLLKILVAIAIVVIIAIVAFRFFVKTEETVTENITVGENEVENNISSTDIKPSDYVGTWGCGRATLTIDKTANYSYDINIMWGDSAWRSIEWKYEGNFDEETGKIICPGNGIKYIVDYDEDGTADAKEEYKNGKATFELKNGGIIWNDEIENAAEDMVFTK